MKLYLSSAWVSSQVPRCWRCRTKKLEMLVGALICSYSNSVHKEATEKLFKRIVQKTFCTNAQLALQKRVLKLSLWLVMTDAA